MAFPSKKQTVKMLKEMEQREKNGEIIGTRLLSKDASAIDKMKFKVCRKILLIKKKYDLTNIQIAEVIGCDSPNVSRIIHCRIDNFTFDKLMNYYELLIESTDNKTIHRAFNKEVQDFLEIKELKFG